MRASGILLHPTSLPGPFGIGELGSKAYEFINLLKTTEQKLWQICPLGPTGYGDSPYSSSSAFAGNPLLISIEFLYKDGYLNENDLVNAPEFNNQKVMFGEVREYKYNLFRTAFENFKKNQKEINNFETFCQKNNEWLHDFAMFTSIKEHFEYKCWVDWENSIKNRKEEAIKEYEKKLSNDITFQKFLQFKFFQQWLNLKNYANQNGISIIGDLPIFVSYDSSDVWANPSLFKLDANGNPTCVAGVPPDYFSKTGQLWGNPIYKWETMKNNNFSWWIKRINVLLKLVDIIRIDHFRGFEAYWEVPAGEKTAINGQWTKSPGDEFFTTIKNTIGKLPIIAEDLGIITDEVTALRTKFEFPGMKILQFAFGNGQKDYLPHNYEKNCVVYTGTHDNDTTLGWLLNIKETDYNTYKHVIAYTDSNEKELCWDLIKLALSSAADTSIIPMQDILNLDNSARFNMPGVGQGNWAWRFEENLLNDDIIKKLAYLTKLFER